MRQVVRIQLLVGWIFYFLFKMGFYGLKLYFKFTLFLISSVEISPTHRLLPLSLNPYRIIQVRPKLSHVLSVVGQRLGVAI